MAVNLNTLINEYIHCDSDDKRKDGDKIITGDVRYIEYYLAVLLEIYDRSWNTVGTDKAPSESGELRPLSSEVDSMSETSASSS